MDPFSGPMASWAALSPARSMSERPTNQPALANRLAQARPMPLAAPVMKMLLRPSAGMALAGMAVPSRIIVINDQKAKRGRGQAAYSLPLRGRWPGGPEGAARHGPAMPPQ